MPLITFGRSITVSLDTDSFAFTVSKGKKVFKTLEFSPFIEFKNGDKVLLSDAKTKDSARYDRGRGEGALIRLSGFDGDTLDLSLYTWVEDSCARLHAELVLHTESNRVIKEIAWPAPLYSFDAKEGYSVLNLMNGKLVYDSSDEECHPSLDRLLLGREAYIPFWGQIADGGSGYLAIVNTPWDARYQYDKLPQKPMAIGIRWIPSLDKIAYKRAISYDFYESGADYVKMCKDYRKYTTELGRFVSLREKIAKNPILERMIGGAVIHTPFVKKHVTPVSFYYNKEDPSKNDSHILFSDIADRLEALHSMGVEGAYVHIDGWGAMGYDNEHPDVLPPAKESGGYEGMSDMLARIRKIGFIPAIHDNYRDYYTAASTYNDDQAQVFADGTYSYEDIWYGGMQRKLCSELALGYLRRNYTDLRAHDCLPDGAYLDVFSVGLMDECANDMHRVTRRECIEYRCQCFHYLRSLGMISSSEEPLDEFVNALDLVHHSPDFVGKLKGVSIPLFELVYHDALLIPSYLGKGLYDSQKSGGFLYCLLQGNIPYVDYNATEEHLALVSVARELHRDVALFELMSHKFISDNIQESVFANGTTVRADFESGEYKISFADGRMLEGRL